MAYAVVMQVTLSEGGTGDEGRRMLEETVVPHAKTQSGFQRGIWMRNGANGMGIVTFDTEDNARAALEQLKPPPGGPTLVSSEVFEVGAEA